MLSNDTKFGFISCKKVTKFVCIHCALSLQIIKLALRAVWFFSIALNSGNKSSTSYLDVRLKFVLGDTLYNVHLLAIPMFESHTDLNMFNSLKKTMDALCVGWEKKVLEHTSDGASNMTGCVQGLGTRIGNVAGRVSCLVCCAPIRFDCA